MLFTQKLKPEVSGSRPRKSRYCWRTKKLLVSIGFVAVLSLSVIVTVAVLFGPGAKLAVGLTSDTVKDSDASGRPSFTIRTSQGLLTSPGPKVIRVRAMV